MKRYDDNWELEIKPILDTLEMGDTDNYFLMPINAFPFNDENCSMYNHIISCLKGSHFKTIKRTPSGGISTTTKASYDVRYKGGCIELTIHNYDGKSCRLQMRNSATQLFNENKMIMSGHMAFNEFKATCKAFKIDLGKYAHLNEETALKEKNEIEDPLIKVLTDSVLDETLFNVHHIDFHSSYMSGLVNTHPEFRDVVEYIYAHRKDDDIKFKSILNMTQGYMQSAHCKYKYAHLSRDMIKDNNDRIRHIVKRMLETGRFPLLLNTDGIWYQGPMYHDENEGTGICTWGHDHTNCKLRIKSKGAYEYVENGKYYPVVRGYTKLDRLKPREEWKWGDIYRNESEPVMYSFKDDYIWWDNENKGAVEYE